MTGKYGLLQNQVGNSDCLSCTVIYFAVFHLQSFLGPTLIFPIRCQCPLIAFAKAQIYQIIYLFYFFPLKTSLPDSALLCWCIFRATRFSFWSFLSSPHDLSLWVLCFWIPMSSFLAYSLPLRITFSSGFLRKGTWEALIIFWFMDVSEYLQSLSFNNLEFGCI